MRNKIELRDIVPPLLDCTMEPVTLSDETMEERKQKILASMKKRDIDSLVIYGDVEHGSNFEYLVGFLPRFEEAMLVLHADGEAYLVLGNENLNKAVHSRIAVTAIHDPVFSLPNQPMEGYQKLSDVFKTANIKEGNRVGVVGWKLFTKVEHPDQYYDVPHYMIEELKHITDSIVNATDLFIGRNGVRTTCNANEIAFYEFYSSLASDCMLKAMDALEVGISEMELGNILNAAGQRNTVVTIAATGDRFYKGNLYPSSKKVQLGDKMSLTVGYRGGLSSRAGYAVHAREELPAGKEDYLEKVVIPYYDAIVSWLEQVHIGLKGGDIYDLIDAVLPRNIYNWSLCPGHLTGYEEWISSPIYQHSNEIIQSGMMFQVDILPSVVGYAGANAESTVVVADEALRLEIKKQNPELWHRFETRRAYIVDVLQINLHEDILPMASTVGYLRPYLLNKKTAMTKSTSK